jgi:hypothetical protein
MANALDTGVRVLAALDAGRAKAIRQNRALGAANTGMVRPLLDVDILEGRPARGRAGRIARKLRGRLGERAVHRILARLANRSEIVCDDGLSTNNELNK